MAASLRPLSKLSWGREILEDAGVPVPWVPSLRDGDMADSLETRYSPTCYHTKFRHSTSNRLGLVRGREILEDAWVLVPWVPSLRDGGHG